MTWQCDLRFERVMDKKLISKSNSGFSLEHPQGVGRVGIVGTVGIVGIVGIEFCRPEPRPTTPSVLVDMLFIPKRTKI